jgi:putative serine/threonine protein kinase
MKQSFIKISKITESPESNIWVYPRGTKAQIKSRIKELQGLGIDSISLQGELKIGTVNVLGKGYVGIVVLGKLGRKKVAVKIRRNDSPRKNLTKEAQLLQITNRCGVGPKLVTYSKNFLVIEYLEGEKIGNYIDGLSGRGNITNLKAIIKKVLEDCYKLDSIGLDHGELSRMPKHVIIGNKITIIDFESSSTKRRVSNVTSATQAFYIGSRISKTVNRIYKTPKKEKIISILRNYKQDQNRKNFEKLLNVLKL